MCNSAGRFYRRIEMQAVEFETKVENGVIHIPAQYIDTLSDNVKVIILPEEKSSQEPRKKKKLYYIGIDMTGYKFDREEANERR
jgi:hypothetical protein